MEEPQRYRPLNVHQLALLNLLYKFRFATAAQIAIFSNKKGSKYVEKRLKILEAQRLIAKRYDKSYKLSHKPAAYYLLPKGLRALFASKDHKVSESVMLKAIYKDGQVSESFIEHCLNIVDVYLNLRLAYADKLIFLTKTDLGHDRYDYLPNPLPDAYVRLDVDAKESPHYFLDIFEDSKPYFVLVRRVKKYFDYAESGDWLITDTPEPAILMVAPNESVQKRLRKRITRELEASWEDDLAFATTTLSRLQPANDDNLWSPVDDDREGTNYSLLQLREK